MTGLNHIVNQYCINTEVLEKMPANVQEIYLETWRNFYLERVTQYLDEDDEKQVKEYRNAGVELNTITSEELAGWKKVAKPINAAYYEGMQKQGVNGEKIVKDYQDLYRKYERDDIGKVSGIFEHSNESFS